MALDTEVVFAVVVTGDCSGGQAAVGVAAAMLQLFLLFIFLLLLSSPLLLAAVVSAAVDVTLENHADIVVAVDTVLLLA